MMITEITPGTKEVEPVQRFEIFTGSGRRRDWGDEEKALIVAESYLPDISVCAVARRHGLSPSQLFCWRRLARERDQVGSGVAPLFMPAIVEAPQDAVRKTTRSPRPTKAASFPAAIEVDIGGARMRIASGANAQMIAAVVRALKASL